MLRGLLSAIGVYSLYHRWLRMQIDPDRLPEHIGVILDGNRRWASAREMIPWEGHRLGAEKVKKFLEWALDLGIKTVTLYAFSTENFNRSEEEVQELMRIYEENLNEVIKADVIHEHQVRINAIGRMAFSLRGSGGSWRRLRTLRRTTIGSTSTSRWRTGAGLR